MENDDKILDSVDTDIDLSQSLLKLLEDKKDALEHFDSFKLEKIVPEIDNTINLLEENQNRRNSILNSLGLDDGDRGLKSYIKSIKNASAKEKYSNHIKSLEQILARLQELNMINAKVIKYNSMQVNQRLGELYGSNSSTTYNENADQSSHVGSRISGKI